MYEKMKEKQEQSKEKTEQSEAVRKRKNGNVGLEDSHSETRVRNRKQKKVPKETILKKSKVGTSKKTSKKTTNKATEIKLGGYLLSMQYLGDEISEFRVNIYLRQKWTDPRLSFPTTDGKTNSIRFPDKSWKQIWIPDTFLREARDEVVDADMSSNRLLKVNPNGEVLYVVKLSTVVSAKFDLKNFPFDTQRLRLHFESFGNTMDSLHYTTLNGGFDFERGLTAGQFSINNVSSHDCSTNYTAGVYPCLQFDFALERKSCQFFLQFYLPSILIVILSWLAFWIDLETSTPSRLLTGIFSLIALILLNGVAAYISVATQYKTSFSCWMVASYVLVFGTLVEFAVVNILSKSSGAAHGFEYLKAPFAGSEKANEAKENHVNGSGGDGKRKARLVDWFSRIFFPVAFLLFNIIYWIMVRA